MENNNLLKNLNDSQLEAILYTDGPSIIIAGAGVGKTRVLTHKISYLISVLKVPSQKILALTFTNKAAKEMKSRIENLVDNTEEKISVYTYHSFCAWVLRKEAYNLDIRNDFNIIDNDDQKKIIRSIYQKEFQLTADATELKILISFISQWKNMNLTKEEIMNEYFEQKEWVIRAKAYEQYIKYQKDNSCLDFDDLLLLVAKIFSEFPHVLNKWQNYFNFILVDEFQDTNNLQYQILLDLSQKHKNLTVVGDPDQTIYSWRGANINLILKFNEKFDNSKTFILDQNYRSTSKILDVANSLIKNNKQRIEKKLYTENNIGENITVYHALSSMDEAKWVAKEITSLKNKKQLKLNEIAILYRNNYLSKDIEQALINKNLNYRIIGGFKFFERKEIKDLIAYLKIIAWNDNLSTIRILNTLPKIGNKTIDNLTNQANELNITLFDFLKNHYKFKEEKVSTNNLYSFVKLIANCQENIDNSESLFELTNKIITETEMINNLKKNFENERVDNINQLLGQLSEYDKNKESEIKGLDLLTTFLQEISLFSNIDEENNLEAINLMTIHSAKGLEFKAVFIIGINEGVLPGIDNKNDILNIKEQEKLEEERRIFYVAITRARNFLFLSSAAGYSFVLKKTRCPSIFFKDLNKEHLNILNGNYQEPQIFKKEKKYNDFSSLINRKNNSSNSSKNNWKINDVINHDLFGKGIVTRLLGDKIQVAFDKKNGGSKIISASHPNIKKIEKK